MPSAIDITTQFPPTRERTVLLELLKVVQNLQAAGVETVLCGGWVPFLKQLARENVTSHSMSFDIDLLFRQAVRERETVDRIKTLLIDGMDFRRSKTESFRYEKRVEGNLVELDLLVDFPRGDNDEGVLKVHGINSSLDLCMADGAADLAGHVETIQISWQNGDQAERSEITIPNSVGFLMLKSEVCFYREKSKDPYDIYYYCRYSEDPATIRQQLETMIAEPAVRKAIDHLRLMFRWPDSKWVELALDHIAISDLDERAREAQFIVRSIERVIAGL